MSDRRPSAGEVEALAALLGGVRLGLESRGESWVVRYEAEIHPVPRLPLSDLEPGAERAERVAVAAGLEAAVKYPGALEDQDFRTGAATLLPRIERARFVEAYDAVLEGRGAGDDERLLARDLGAGLVVLYVKDEGWRFRHVTRGQAARWGESPGTVDAGARSNLYHRAEVAWDSTEIALGDGYDAARAVLAADVFYHLGSREDGIPIAIPDRDRLLVGGAASPDRARAAFEAAKYPLAPHPLRFRDSRVRIA